MGEKHLAILREPIVGPAKAGHDAKERTLLLADLDATECALLAQRLAKARAGDPIVAAELSRHVKPLDC